MFIDQLIARTELDVEQVDHLVVGEFLEHRDQRPPGIVAVDRFDEAVALYKAAQELYAEIGESVRRLYDEMIRPAGLFGKEK